MKKENTFLERKVCHNFETIPVWCSKNYSLWLFYSWPSFACS